MQSSGFFLKRRWLYGGLWAALSACTAAPAAAPSQAPTPAVQLRVSVKLVRDTDDPRLVERAIGPVASVPVRYIAGIGGAWHAIMLSCSDEAACDAAIDRLRAQTSVVAAVERDQQRRRNAP